MRKLFVVFVIALFLLIVAVGCIVATDGNDDGAGRYTPTWTLPPPPDPSATPTWTLPPPPDPSATPTWTLPPPPTRTQ